MSERAIFIVRHAETRDNAARVVQVADAPLSARGQVQAERLARRLAEQSITRILTSDLARAVATANCVGATIGVVLEPEALLRERDFGELRGQPHALLGFNLFDRALVPPGGESWAAFYARVAQAWAHISQIAAQTPGNLLVMTHGLVCAALVERHFQLPSAFAPPTHWGNTGVTQIDAMAPWQVRQLNCTAHLDAESLRTDLKV